MTSTIQDQVRELRKLLSGFQASRVILTANNFMIFDLLISSRSAAESAQALGTDVRATEILLDALTGLGLLKKSGGKYRNAPIANRLLVSNAPASMAWMILTPFSMPIANEFRNWPIAGFTFLLANHT